MNDCDDYHEVTQSDMKRAVLRVGGKPAPRQQTVSLLLDTTVIEYFKMKAGKSDYQELINDALRRVILQEMAEEE